MGVHSLKQVKTIADIFDGRWTNPWLVNDVVTQPQLNTGNKNKFATSMDHGLTFNRYLPQPQGGVRKTSCESTSFSFVFQRSRSAQKISMVHRYI